MMEVTLGNQPPGRGNVCCVACDHECHRSKAGEHAAAQGPAHALCLDVLRAELYCALCGDYVYDPTFDRGVLVARLRASNAARAVRPAPPPDADDEAESSAPPAAPPAPPSASADEQR